MHSMGNIIKCLRKATGVTQDEMARSLGVSYQAVSKWENDSSQPDIQLLPAIATYFGVTIDELFGYKLSVMTNKERFIDFMAKNRILCKGEFTLKCGATSNYYINTEQFSTNAQISKIGEVFADCIRENNLAFDTVLGLAYHGISFSAATAVSLYNKHGITCNYCHSRKTPDRRGRMVCGHTLQDGEKVILIDDLLTTGQSIREQADYLQSLANIQITAIIVIMDRSNPTAKNEGAEMLATKYGTRVYSLVTDEDIHSACQKGIITL